MDLKIARIKAGISAKVAADRMGIHPSALSRIENGKTKAVGAAVVWRMAALYGCPAAELLEALYGPAALAVAHG